MSPRRFYTAAAFGLTAALALSACASSGSSDGGSDGGSATGPKTVPTVTGSDKTLTVWAMNGDYTADTLNAINAEFTKQTGAKVDVQMQDWDGITTKISTALSTSGTPDVLDLGNTQVASFAANGGLVDVTDYKADLAQGRTWLGGLEEPATVDGKLYAIPGFAAPARSSTTRRSGRRRGHGRAHHVRRAHRGPGQDQGQEHRRRLLGLLHAGSVLGRGHAVGLGRGRRDRHRRGR